MTHHHRGEPEDRSADSGNGTELEDEVHAVSVASLPWQEAWLMAGRLRSEGIPARVYPDFEAWPFTSAQSLPVARMALGEAGLGRSAFDVMVPGKFERQARAIVRQVIGR